LISVSIKLTVLNYDTREPNNWNHSNEFFSICIWVTDFILMQTRSNKISCVNFSLTLHAPGTAIRVVCLRWKRLRVPFPASAFPWLSSRCSIRLRTSAWFLLFLSCSSLSFLFSSASFLLLVMTSSNNTKQSSDKLARTSVGTSTSPSCLSTRWMTTYLLADLHYKVDPNAVDIERRKKDLQTRRRQERS